MDLRYWGIVVCLLFAGFGCTPNENQGSDSAVILFKDHRVDRVNPVFDTFDFIKLETSTDCLIGDIDRVVAHDGRLFMLTNPAMPEVLVFDDSGKFLWKLSRGRGPNETLSPIDIAIDEKENALLVLDMGNAVKKFSLSGQYITTVPLEKPAFYVETLDGGALFYDPNMVDTSDHRVTYVQNDGQTRSLLEKGKHRQGVYRDRGFGRISPDSVLISSIFSDQVYVLSAGSKSLDTLFTLDFDGEGSNEKAGTCSNYNDYIDYSTENNRFTGPMDVSYSGGRLLFSVKNRDYYYGRYDTGTKKLTLFTRQFHDLPNFYGKVGQAGDQVIYAYDILWLMNHFEENPPRTERGKELQAVCIDPNDNPVIVFGHL